MYRECNESTETMDPLESLALMGVKTKIDDAFVDDETDNVEIPDHLNLVLVWFCTDMVPRVIRTVHEERSLRPTQFLAPPSR